jgi:inner membrane protein
MSNFSITYSLRHFRPHSGGSHGLRAIGLPARAKIATVGSMPSPIGHALGAVAAGGLVASGGSSPRAVWPRIVTFAALGILPDLDLVAGAHSRQTHSLGAVLLVATAGALIVGAGRWRLWLGAALAYGSHVLLDWLGSDTSAPIGIMALWPFSSAFYQSDLRWFDAISRRYWLPEFWTHNPRAIAREIALLGPPAVLVWWMGTRPWRARPRRRAG